MSPPGLSVLRAVFLALLAFASWAIVLGAQENAPAQPESMYVEIGQRTGPENLVYGFFEPESGRRIARLQVARVRLDYGKHGLFRVAWKARPLLSGVELRIDDETAWPAVVGQLADVLHKMSGAGGALLRDVVIVRPDETMRLTAAEAEFTPAQQLVLSRAKLADATEHRVVLPLRGPQAGQFQFLDLQLSPSPRPGITP